MEDREARAPHGFGLPFGVWLTRHAGLMALARDSLRSLGTRNIVRPAFIDALLEAKIGLNGQPAQPAHGTLLMFWVPLAGPLKAGENTIRFRMLKDDARIQLDLVASLNVDGISLGTRDLKYSREFNAVFVDFPERLGGHGPSYSFPFASPVSIDRAGPGRIPRYPFRTQYLRHPFIRRRCASRSFPMLPGARMDQCLYTPARSTATRMRRRNPGRPAR